MLKIGNNILSSLKVGSTPVKSVYVGTAKVYPGVIRVDSGTVYGDWSYNGATRTRTVTPWTQEVYQDGTKGQVVNNPAPNQSETAVSSYRYGAWGYYSDNSYRQRSRTLVYTFTDTARDGATDTVTENGSVAFGAWSYNAATRTRSVTYHYSDTSKAGTAQTESAGVSTDWDGSYWNGVCGSSYYYVDYQKVRTKYTFSDAVTYGGYYNGESRSRRIEGSCGWDRTWRVAADWANNGATCNAAGTAGAYDCDGTYTVKYYQQQRTLYYCFPDMSGSTNTSVEYRPGGQYSRNQVDGCCGYVARVRNELRVDARGNIDNDHMYMIFTFDHPVTSRILVSGTFNGHSWSEYIEIGSKECEIGVSSFNGFCKWRNLTVSPTEDATYQYVVTEDAGEWQL